VPTESWLSILASSCARTTTLRARSVNFSNILRWPFWQIPVAGAQNGPGQALPGSGKPATTPQRYGPAPAASPVISGSVPVDD